MHEIVENEMDEQTTQEKTIRWEAIREQCMTLGARDGLDRAMRGGHVLFDYLWFVIVVMLLLIGLGKVGGCDERDPARGSHIPAEVKGGVRAGLR